MRLRSPNGITEVLANAAVSLRLIHTQPIGDSPLVPENVTLIGPAAVDGEPEPL